MASQDSVLVALKVLLPSLDVDPAPAQVWHYPNDYAAMVAVGYESLPIIGVYEAVNQPDSWSRLQDGLGLHSWSIGISCLLYPGPITSMKKAAPAEVAHKGWVKAMADLLLANQSLSGAALYIGEVSLPAALAEGGVVAGSPSQLFEYRVGQLEWDDKIFWGIQFSLPVLQTHGQTMGG